MSAPASTAACAKAIGIAAIFADEQLGRAGDTVAALALRADMAGDDHDVGLPLRLADQRRRAGRGRRPASGPDCGRRRQARSGCRRSSVWTPMPRAAARRRRSTTRPARGQVAVGGRPTGLAEIAAMIVGVGHHREAGAAQIGGVEGRAAEGEAERRVAALLGVIAAGVHRPFEIAEHHVAGVEADWRVARRAPRRGPRPATHAGPCRASASRCPA